MRNFNKKINKKGFSLIEVVIACSIISISVFALMSTTAKSIQVSSHTLKQAQATLLIEEGVEAVKSIRDNNWDDVSSLSGIKYLSFNSSWSLVDVDPGEIDGTFSRTVLFEDITRDGDDNIASSGTEDDGTKKVTITVYWYKQGILVNRSLSFYISNIFN